MKGQHKPLEKYLNEKLNINQPFRKRIQNNDSEDDPEFRKENGEDARAIYQRPKKQTNRDEWLH